MDNKEYIDLLEKDIMAQYKESSSNIFSSIPKSINISDLVDKKYTDETILNEVKKKIALARSENLHEIDYKMRMLLNELFKYIRKEENIYTLKDDLFDDVLPDEITGGVFSDTQTSFVIDKEILEKAKHLGRGPTKEAAFSIG